MAYKVQKPCKFCGKMYTPCADCEKDSTFRWRKVACSKECAMKYFALVEAARNPKTEKTEVEKENKEVIEKFDVKNVEEEVKETFVSTPKKFKKEIRQK